MLIRCHFSGRNATVAQQVGVGHVSYRQGYDKYEADLEFGTVAVVEALGVVHGVFVRFAERLTTLDKTRHVLWLLFIRQDTSLTLKDLGLCVVVA